MTNDRVSDVQTLMITATPPASEQRGLLGRSGGNSAELHRVLLGTAGRLGSHTACACIQALPLAVLGTLGKSQFLSVPRFPGL